MDAHGDNADPAACCRQILEFLLYGGKRHVHQRTNDVISSTSAVNAQPHRRRGRHGGWYLAGFVMLFALSLLKPDNLLATAATRQQQAALLGGTIPPGGTVPTPPIDPQQGQVRVFHLAPIGSTASSTVDICTEANQPVSGLTGLTYLSQSGYIPLTPGTYDWKVGDGGCTTTVLDLPPFQVAAGTALTLLIVGDGVNQPLASILLVDDVGRFYPRYLPLVLAQ